MFKHYIFFLAFLGLECSGSVQAQSYNYIRYTQRDGLASSTVYSMLQDKQGFMWFGTETGLCRFDGTNFKTFTTKDGLPDNEILKMYEDSKGRIWLLPFRNAICYYYKGKIYNQQNDSLLGKIKIKDRILSLFETKEGSIMMCESDHLYSIKKNSEITETDIIDGIRLRSVLLFEKDENDRIWFSTENNGYQDIYSYYKGKAVLFSTGTNLNYQNSLSFSGPIKAWINKERDLKFYSENLNIADSIPSILSIYLKIIPVNDSLITLCSVKGAVVYNIKSHKDETVLLENFPASGVLEDAEGNIWVCTAGFGVFRFQDRNFHNIKIGEIDSPNKGAFGLDCYNGSLMIGLDNCTFAEYEIKSLKQTRLKQIYPNDRNVKITNFVDPGKNKIIVSTYYVLKLDSGYTLKEKIENLFPKQVFKKEDLLYIATTSNVMRFDVKKFEIKDTVWSGRSTSVFLTGDSMFVGTLKGLYLVYKGNTTYLGDRFSFLKGRISAITKTDDNSFWVASYDNGIYQFNSRGEVKHYSMENGLPSNICRTLTIDKESVWIGTDKGLVRISYLEKEDQVTTISKSDGLNSDYINKILIYGDTVFVATSEGVSYFNKRKLSQYSECRLNILDVYSREKLLEESNSYKLTSNSIKVSFVGISFRSAGNILYRYRLKGIDDEWKTTRETTLEFVALPYGDYELEIIAENKFGVVSNKVSILLHVPIPFWKSAWFYSLLIIVAGTVTYILYQSRLRKIQSQEQAKTAFNKKIAEMEMKALRAQMNPHFTFNVLNSIQYFIGYNDTVAAQRYLSRFSKLIRMTLDNSKNVFIPLADEVSLLELYLSLEKMRFDEKFNYRISVEGELSRDRTLVPNMLVQPFIENAVKHGFKEGVTNAEIEITFTETGSQVVCTITDNGIGRTRAAAMQNASGEQHKSAGLSMIKDKVDALAYYYNYQISVEVADLSMEAGKTVGTKVIIKMPKKVSDM